MHHTAARALNKGVLCFGGTHSWCLATGNRLDWPGQEQQDVQLKHVRRKEAGSGLAKGFAFGCTLGYLVAAFCTDR
ncbi:hypothetical protein WJX77_003141 [Trebouxia sp. C0004]